MHFLTELFQSNWKLQAINAGTLIGISDVMKSATSNPTSRLLLACFLRVIIINYYKFISLIKYVLLLFLLLVEPKLKIARDFPSGVNWLSISHLLEINADQKYTSETPFYSLDTLSFPSWSSWHENKFLTRNLQSRLIFQSAFLQPIEACSDYLDRFAPIFSNLADCDLDLAFSFRDKNLQNLIPGKEEKCNAA